MLTGKLFDSCALDDSGGETSGLNSAQRLTFIASLYFADSAHSFGAEVGKLSPICAVS